MSVKISELPSLETLADNDILAGVDTSEDTTSKITLEKIKNYATEDVYDKEEVDDTIDALQTQIDSLSTIYNAFPTVSDEGESMTLDDTAEVTFKKLDLKGNTSQVQYTGKNLFNVDFTTRTLNGITFTNNNDGSITLNGTSTNAGGFSLGARLSNLEAGTYTISKNMSSSINGVFLIAYGSNDSGVQIGNTANDASATFTTNTNYNEYWLYIYIANSGIALNNLKLEPMLEKGSSATSFEPYVGGTASPNPSYPQPINVVSGDNEINICGKNLMEFDNPNNPSRSGYTYTSETPELVVCTKNGSGNDFYAQFIAYLESGQTYTLSVEDSTNRNIYMYSDKLWGTGISGLTNKNSRKGAPLTFTSTYTGKAVIGFFGGGSQTLTQPMLVKGNTASTTYEPYIGNSYPLYLGVENLIDTIDIYNGFTNGAVGGTIGYTASANTITYKKCAYVEAGQDYILYWKPNTPKATGNREIRITDSNDTILQVKTYSNANNNTSTIITPTTSGWVYACLDANATEVVIQKGTTIQYISTTPIELCKIGTYQDYIYKDNGSWYLHKEIGKVVLDGSENWFLRTDVSQASGYYTFRNADYIAGEFTTNSFGYSNYYEVVTSGNAEKNNIRLVNSNGYGTQICINGDIVKTEQELKTWLSTHNTSVYYALANSTNTLIEDTTLIEQLEELKLATSYEGQTNINQTNNDKPFILDVEAIKKLS